MFRFIASFGLSVVLFALELVMVMKISGYSAIQITNYHAILPVMICNFFLAFAMITQLLPWLAKKRIIQVDPDN